MISKEANESINKIVEFLFGDFANHLDSGMPILDCKTYLDELKIKRPDIFVFDKLNLLYKNNLIDNKTFEMILYCADNDFKKIFDGGYDKKIFNAVKKRIQTLDIKISSFQK